ncbi:hypothetical protein GCM10017607_08110 [Microbacterium thalassium]|nr:hypothetical protein GCM10017607_08110 [Microbacterium thalassium]
MSTDSKPSCAYHSQSVYRFAKMKNATTRAAITASDIAMTRRDREGVAAFGAEVVVTPSILGGVRCAAPCPPGK